MALATEIQAGGLKLVVGPVRSHGLRWRGYMCLLVPAIGNFFSPIFDLPEEENPDEVLTQIDRGEIPQNCNFESSEKNPRSSLKGGKSFLGPISWKFSDTSLIRFAGLYTIRPKSGRLKFFKWPSNPSVFSQNRLSKKESRALRGSTRNARMRVAVYLSTSTSP